MTSTGSPAAWAATATLALALIACNRPQTLGDRCLSQYPRPTDAQIDTDTTSIPASDALPLYHPTDALSQTFSADSSTGWYRNLFHAHFAAFPGGERSVRSFLFRFQAHIVGKADTAGWHAVMVHDPGPDMASLTLLQFCAGATNGVYVRAVYSRVPRFLLDDTAARVLPDER